MGWRMAEEGWRKGPWTPAEDKLLMDYVALHGEGRWSSVAGFSGMIHVYLVYIIKTYKKGMHYYRRKVMGMQYHYRNRLFVCNII